VILVGASYAPHLTRCGKRRHKKSVFQATLDRPRRASRRGDEARRRGAVNAKYARDNRAAGCVSGEWSAGDEEEASLKKFVDGPPDGDEGVDVQERLR